LNDKQDRHGVRTAADLERKYQFNKRFAEIMGIALDAQNAVSVVESDLRHEILEQATSITRSTSEIIMTALETYVETTDLEEFKKTISAEFKVLADEISGRVTAAETKIGSVDTDLQERFNLLSKYLSFTINGLKINATYIDDDGVEKTCPNEVVIDNDDVTIYSNGNIVQEFKADGTGLIPKLNVTTLANILGLQITEDDTHINIEYVGVG
jgi:hypothetical protein